MKSGKIDMLAMVEPETNPIAVNMIIRQMIDWSFDCARLENSAYYPVVAFNYDITNDVSFVKVIKQVKPT